MVRPWRATMRQAGPTSMPMVQPNGSKAVARSSPPTAAAAHAGPRRSSRPDACRDADGDTGSFCAAITVVAAAPLTGGSASRASSFGAELQHVTRHR